MKKSISLLLILITLCLSLSSCSNKEALIGTWKPKDLDLEDEYVIVFREDGTGLYLGDPIKYEVKGKNLSIWFEGTESFNTTFRIDNDELIFKDSSGNDVFLVRK